MIFQNSLPPLKLQLPKGNDMTIPQLETWRTVLALVHAHRIADGKVQEAVLAMVPPAQMPELITALAKIVQQAYRGHPAAEWEAVMATCTASLDQVESKLQGDDDDD